MPRAPFHDLRSYLSALENAGELARVKCEVDPEYEITEIVQEAMAKDGPALVFERVKGSPYGLAVNLFGKMSRIELAFGRHPEEIGREFARLGEKMAPPTVKAVLSEWRALARLRHLRVKRASLKARPLPTPWLTSLPVLKCWPGDAGRFLTFGLVISASPRSGKQNMGIYRMQLLDDRRVAMHWQIEKGGAAHEAEYGGGKIPVAIVVGADPATMFAAACPLPEDMDELGFAGLLRGASTRLARGTDLNVPVSAEFLIEGMVDPSNRVPEGPFGDHFGHYSHQAPFPVFEATRMSARRDAIYVASVVGKPPQEDRAMGEAIQGIFNPLLRLIHPELVDVWAYHEAGFHNLLVVSVRQRYAREGMKTACGLLGQGQMSLTKCVILVDPAVNVKSFPEVLRAIRENFDASEDLQVLHRTAPDTLDFTGMVTDIGGTLGMNLGSKVIIDATSYPPSDGKPRGAKSREAARLLPFMKGNFRLWEDTLLVVQVSEAVVAGSSVPAATDAGRGILEGLVSKLGEGIPLVAVVSSDVDLNSDSSLLWGIFTRFDAARDIVPAKSEIRGVWPKLTGPIGIDATFKRGYPLPVVMLPEVRGMVRARWREYGLNF